MHLENRLIAMLDVLGLANQISEPNELEKVIERYKSLIKVAREQISEQETVKGSIEPKVYNFEVGEFVFDTVVLVSYPVDVKSSCKFILAVKKLMQLFAKENMPLRGCVGLGDYVSDKETNIFLSNIFKQLSAEEKEQQWSGCILLEGVESLLVDNLMGMVPATPKSSDVIHKLHIPTKSNMEGSRWCVNWSFGLSDQDIESILTYMQGDKVKQINTKQYFEEINSMADDSKTLPAEFSPATKLKTMKTRSSMLIHFEDANGVQVKPGCNDWQLFVD